MAQGNNYAEVMLAKNMISGSVGNNAMGSYDGGKTTNADPNRIDFSATLMDDLYFISNSTLSNVYGFALESSNTASPLPVLGSITSSAIPTGVIDGGTFSNFQIVNTGAVNNNLEIDTGTTIQALSLDGLQTNNLNLNLNNPSSSFFVKSSFMDSSSSVINLQTTALNLLSIAGRGGYLMVNLDGFSGQLLLDLANNSGSAFTTVSDFGELLVTNNAPMIFAQIESTTNIADEFYFYGGTQDWLQIDNPSSSSVVINENGPRSGTALNVSLIKNDWSQITSSLSYSTDQFTAAIGGHVFLTINFTGAGTSDLPSLSMTALTASGSNDTTTYNLLAAPSLTIH